MEEETSPRANIGGARGRARKLIKDARVTQAPVFINQLISIIQKDFNLRISRTNALPDKCDALTANVSGKITIASNASKSLNRQKFSVGHEIGHLYMGHVHTGGQINLDSREINEVEANAFGAELIMPLSLLKKDVMQERDIKELAKLYAVSEEAMGWRLLETGLFKKM